MIKINRGPKGRILEKQNYTGSKKVRAKAQAFKDKQAKLHRRKERQVRIEFLKGARKRGKKK